MSESKAYQIRRARVEDAAAIHLAHMRSINEICAKDYSSEEIAGWGGREFDKFKRTLTIQEHWVWVVEIEGLGVSGFGHVRPPRDSGSKVAWLNALYFTPEAVGRGAGAALLAQMESFALSQGVDRMELQSTLNSRRFYERAGYIQVGPETRECINCSEVRCLPMGKMLSKA